MARWAFLTNHARVLACIADEPGVRQRDIALKLGITERAANRIVDELVEDGYVSRHRLGRRNFYEVHPEAPLRGATGHPETVGALLRLLIDRRREGEAA